MVMHFDSAKQRHGNVIVACYISMGYCIVFCCILIYLKAAASAAELQKSIFQEIDFFIVRLSGGFGMVRNTPTGCGNNLPTLLRSDTFC